MGFLTEFKDNKNESLFYEMIMNADSLCCMYFKSFSILILVMRCFEMIVNGQ